MNSEFELIRYNDNLPARIEIKQGEITTPYHWHKEIELVYVLDGALEININNSVQTLHTDEFRLINSVENHSLSAENTKYLILDISYEFASQFDESLYSSVFKVIGGSGAEEELRNLLWQLSRTVNEQELPGLRQYALITDILHVLFVQAGNRVYRAALPRGIHGKGRCGDIGRSACLLSTAIQGGDRKDLHRVCDEVSLGACDGRSDK